MNKSVFITIGIVLAAALTGFAQESVTLDALISQAKQRNGEIVAARERWKAAQARVPQESSLEQPKLTAEYWSVPEGSLDLGAAGEKMYGFDQMVPFPGKRKARGKAAGYEAEGMLSEYRNTELKVVADLKTAYAMYYATTRAIETYRQTADIMRNYSKVAESRYALGKAMQSEVLRAQVEAEKMSTMVVNLEQEKEAARAEINQLAGNSVDSPLSEPQEPARVFLAKSWEEVRGIAVAKNPEIAKSNADVSRGQWSEKAAQLDALPDFNIGFRRKQMNDMWAGSDVMFGITVPLWYGRQKAMVEEKTAERKAAESSKSNVELMTLAQAKEAWTRLGSTQRLIELYTASVLPKSEQSLRVAQSSYTAGKLSFLELLDSVRSYLEFRLEYYNYIAEYQKNLAALERVAGGELVERR